MKGRYFNSMYMNAECADCGKYVAVICANCAESICETCHNPASVFTKEVQEKIIQSMKESVLYGAMPDRFFMPEYNYLILGGYIWRARWVWIKNKFWGLFK